MLPSHLPRFMSRLHPGHPYYRFTCQTFRRGKGWIRILNCVISIRLGLEVAWRTREGGGRGERERAWERFTTIRFGALLAADLSGERTEFNSPNHEIHSLMCEENFHSFCQLHFLFVSLISNAKQVYKVSCKKV